MKLYRASGAPIDEQHIKLQKEAFNKVMTDLEETEGKCTQENAEIFNKALNKVEEDLAVIYPNCVPLKYPHNKKKLYALCSLYGSIAFCIEDEELVAYILDK